MIKLKPIFILMCSLLACSCVSKKEILYLQDAEVFADKDITYTNSQIQPNDVLSIDVGALIPASTIPYNKGGNSSGGVGYVVLPGVVGGGVGDVFTSSVVFWDMLMSIVLKSTLRFLDTISSFLE